MNFADNLRKNRVIQEDYDIRHADNIVEVIKACAIEKSKNSNILEGYYCTGYDESYIGYNEPYVYVYKEYLGKYESRIVHFKNGLFNSYTSIQRDKIINRIKQGLIELGFKNITVRFEDVMQPLRIGTTEFLHRNKTKDFPAFRIYIKITW